MEPDSDFARYVDARWADLVGGLEHEGVPPSAARMAVAEVLLARRRGWDRLVAEQHVDVHVWAALRDRVGLAPRPGDVPPHAVVETVPGSDDGPDAWFARAHRSRRSRRLIGLRVTLAGALALAVVGGGVAWWESRPEPPAVRQEANSLPVPWYAAGELHLAEVVVSLPDVDAFVALGADVAVLDRSGDFLRVNADGDVEHLVRAPESFDDTPAPPPGSVPTGRYDSVVQSVRLPDGGWAHLLDSSRRAPAGDAVRQSESGRRAVVVCTADGACQTPQTIVQGAVRLH